MKSMKVIYKIISFSIIAFIAGCLSIPKQDNNESSVIAIKVSGTIRLGILSWDEFRPIKVFFIRLDNTDKLISEDIIESTINDTSWLVGRDTTYLFNVEPGKYAAVAAYGTGYASTEKLYIMFSEQLIKSTIVDVEPGTFVYMGEFFAGNVSCDEIQKYYYHYFSSKNKSSNTNYFCGSLKKEFAGKNEKIKFLLTQSEKFKDTQWENNIKRTLQSLVSN